MRKFVVIEPEVLESLKSKNTTQKILSELDKQMKEILDSSKPDSDKIALYNNILQKYLRFQKKDIEPVKIEIAESEKPLSDQELIRPIKRKVKANRLLKHIKGNTATGWDSRGQLVFDGRSIPGSSVQKLIENEIKQESNNLPGVTQFRSVIPKWETLK